jgi:hypothetical protein
LRKPRPILRAQRYWEIRGGLRLGPQGVPRGLPWALRAPPRWLQELTLAQGDGKVLAPLARTDRVVLDDFATAPLTEAGRRDLPRGSRGPLRRALHAHHSPASRRALRYRRGLRLSLTLPSPMPSSIVSCTTPTGSLGKEIRCEDSVPHGRRASRPRHHQSPASLRAVITLPGLTDHVGPERLISLAGIRKLEEGTLDGPLSSLVRKHQDPGRVRTERF